MTHESIDLNSTLNHLWSVAVRKRWWILVTTFVVSLGTIRVSFLTPDRFRSEATIFIARSTVPQEYVLMNNTANAMESVDAIKREVLSRARLEQIINDFGLYPSSRKVGTEALAELMRADIVVEPISKDPERRPMNAFVIAFTSSDPKIAQQVTERLASLFINENLQKQRRFNSSTTNFLHQEVETAKAELDRQDALVREYKLRNLGDLPEQSESNLQVLNGLHMQLQATEASLAGARQERAYLEAMLSHYAPEISAGTRQDAGSSSSVATLERELSKLKSQRDELLAKYNRMYPDVVALEQEIADHEQQLKRLASAQKPAATDEKPANFANILPSDSATYQFRSQLEANTVEIEDLQRRAKQLQKQIEAYQNRLTLAPVRQQQFEELQRSYEMAKQTYTNLVNKENQSELATRLDIQQGNEQFQLIDSASLPLKPTSPHRQKIALGGLAGGLVLGFILAFVVDARDRSFRSENEVRECLGVPIVVGIPPLRTPAERSRLSLRARFEWVLASSMVATLLAAQWFIHHRG